MELLKFSQLTLQHVCRYILGLATLFIFVAHLNTTTGQIDWDDDDDPGKCFFSFFVIKIKI